MQIGQIIFGQAFEGVDHGLGRSSQFKSHLIGFAFISARDGRADGTKEKSDATQIKRNQKQTGVNRRLL